MMNEIREFSFNNSYEEYNVKNAWSQIKTSKTISRYLPVDEMDQGRFPDKKWFWAIAFTCCPQWVRRYHNLVLDTRAKEVKKDVNNKKQITVTDSWMKVILKYDHKSTGKYINYLITI